jgi:DNA polymerase-3 subunit epsilon|uniref:Exonuclease n=1 Tax=Desulfobacca acetoxidans TaxID=60893 RepID=A0A7C5EQ59_9BACT
MQIRSAPSFVAIDFETADYQPDSACALGLARVKGGVLQDCHYYLIKPPRTRFCFTHIHRLTWQDVADQPTFGELWPRIAPLLEGAEFLAAHNAGFDRRVLRSCCETYGFLPPPLPFRCTMELARQVWRIYPTRLPDVCRHLGIALNHHHAVSDAEACARIVLAAFRSGKLR